jgi:polysaccharide pyruvyl transferase WcaK-like protein
MKTKKIGFFGLFGQLNWGNECTLQAIIHNAQRHLSGLEIYCICTDPEDTSKRFGIPAFPIKAIYRRAWWGQNNQWLRLLRKGFFLVPIEILHWVKAYRTVKGTQMLVFPGTGLLTDFSRRIFGRCYEIFKWSIIAKLCKCKLLFVSMGAGPIRHPLSRWFIKSALSMADYRSYRNDYSRQYLKGIGFETNFDPIYPDLAFSLPRSMMPESKNCNRQRPVIGVGVMNYDKYYTNQQGGENIYRDYIEKTCSFVTWLLDNHYTVRMLMGDTLYDSSVKEDLKNMLKKREHDYEDGNILDEPINSVEQLLSQLATTSVVVSPRLHNIILALMLNKPVISLSYHDKIASLVADLGLTEYSQHLDHLDVDRLIEQFMQLEKNAEKLLPSIRKKAIEYRKALDEQYSLIFHDN